MTRLVASLLSLVAFTACLAEETALALDGEDDPFLTGGKADDDLDAAGVLQVANTVSAGGLTDVCRVHTLPAGNIVAARPIADLAALDAIDHVGPAVVANLQRCWHDHYRDGGTGGWRGAFDLPTGTVELAVNLVMPAFQNDQWENIDRNASDVLADPAVQLEPVMEYAQCMLRGQNPGRVYLECRRRGFRPNLMPGLSVARDRRSFTLTAEIATDGTFDGHRLTWDGRPHGERHLIWIAGRLGANRTITVTTWKYVYITPYGDDSLQPRLIDLVWGADEAAATFRAGTWEHFDEVFGATMPIAAGTARQPYIRDLGPFESWIEQGDGTERVVDVPAFAIDETPVTKAAYSACVQEGKCTDPCSSFLSLESCTLSNAQQYVSTSQEPIVGLTYWQAARFCAYAGKQLVTTDQWHLAQQASSVSTFARDMVVLGVHIDGQWRRSENAFEVRGGSHGAERKVFIPEVTQPISQFGSAGIRCVRE